MALVYSTFAHRNKGGGGVGALRHCRSYKSGGGAKITEDSEVLAGAPSLKTEWRRMMVLISLAFRKCFWGPYCCVSGR